MNAFACDILEQSLDRRGDVDYYINSESTETSAVWTKGCKASKSEECRCKSGIFVDLSAGGGIIT